MAYFSATIRMSDQRITDTTPVTACDVTAPPRLHRLLQSVERAGADITVDHAECGERSRGRTVADLL
jgi:hypothetical protein